MTYRSSFSSLGKQCTVGLSNRYKALTDYSRTMWHMCSSKSTTENFLRSRNVTGLCQCGCNGLLHTQRGRELADFLKLEIQEEKKGQKMAALPKEVKGFSVIADKAELIFQKKIGNETIALTLNINHSVDTDEAVVGDEYDEEMKARPNFEVDIIHNNSTLNFCCSYVAYPEQGDVKADSFQIDEVALFEGEWNEKNYSVAGDILDENLYDLLMGYLSEKGITNDFVEQVSDVATFYEHMNYINLLEDIYKFSTSN